VSDRYQLRQFDSRTLFVLHAASDEEVRMYCLPVKSIHQDSKLVMCEPCDGVSFDKRQLDYGAPASMDEVAARSNLGVNIVGAIVLLVFFVYNQAMLRQLFYDICCNSGRLRTPLRDALSEVGGADGARAEASPFGYPHE
jgi:hypothetical protein